MAAMSAVFGVSELRDLVRSHLPTKDLVRASGVCAEWHQAIKITSLKQKFFLSPTAASPLSLRWRRKHDKSLQGFEDARELYDTEITSDFSAQVFDSRPPPQIIKLHPLLDRYIDQELYRDSELGCWLKNLLKYEALGRWSDAFISQPSICKMEFSLTAYGTKFAHVSVLQDNDGLKLRHIQEEIQRALEALHLWHAAQGAAQAEDEDAVENANEDLDADVHQGGYIIDDDSDYQVPDDRKARKLAKYGGYLDYPGQSVEECMQKWGETAPGLVVCTIRGCAADSSPWVKSAVPTQAA
ncbi:hypothetical protein LTR85_012064 [Meristemomyces frigidus]|nr:hypothetical protein LTR85_012064 [Meristemomyces frigidus]